MNGYDDQSRGFDLFTISSGDDDEFVARYSLQMLFTDAGKDTFDKNVTMARLALSASFPTERFASYQSRGGEYTRVLGLTFRVYY